MPGTINLHARWEWVDTGVSAHVNPTHNKQASMHNKWAIKMFCELGRGLFERKYFFIDSSYLVSFIQVQRMFLRFRKYSF